MEIDRRHRMAADKEVHQMLDLYTAGSFAPDATDPRNLFHERALREARIASEYRELAAASQGPGLLSRIRAALSGARVAPATQACDCPA
jgi:hypothetical protein